MLQLFDYLDSGNGYKVRLLLHQLGLPFEWFEADILAGETRQAPFLARNPIGRIPCLRLEDGRYLAESNAILFYLAQGTAYFPTDRFLQAQTLQWLFFEQYDHEPNIAVARFWLKHLEMSDQQRGLLPERQQKGYAALSVMEAHLAENSFFVGNRYSIADIALFAYTHVAAEGGFSLERLPGRSGLVGSCHPATRPCSDHLVSNERSLEAWPQPR